MKKKSVLAVALTLSLLLAMAVPTFAVNPNANVNGDAATEVTLPGSPEYDATRLQSAGQSFNAASVTSKDGTTWNTANDDDKVTTANDTTGADINVWAKVTDSGSKIYKVDLAWGAMKFEYNSGSGQWNTTSHAYDATSGTAAWTPTYIDGTNNKVAVTNHSNNAVDAAFVYKMEGTKFNEVNGVDNVIGNFFAENAKALAAGLVLKGTYSDTNGAVNTAAVADKLAGSKVSLPTADRYNSTPGAADNATDATNDKPAGGRLEDVFFAFSGTPDAGKGAALDTFKKVGVITVTVTPNHDKALNRAPFTK